ncbi:MAG: DUF2254 domain-containing protein, partial [Candidatus Rokuibacteriota bacterium]
LQMIEPGRLMRAAEQHDLVLRLVVRPGDFVLAGHPLAFVWPRGRLEGRLPDALRRAFVVGSQRTPFQDVEFGIWQLVEIALRALSPGIHDPHTAIACVDRLAAALGQIGQRELPAGRRHDERGHLRVIAEPVTIRSIVDVGFDEIRQAARSNVAVTLRLLEAVSRVAPTAGAAGMGDALLRQAGMIVRGSREAIAEPRDREDIEARYRAAVAALGAETDQARRAG